LAGELDARTFYAGALYQYLDAVQQLALLSQAAPDSTHQASVRTSLAALRKQLDASNRDESIGQLFLERAEAALSTAGGATPGEAEWKRAQVIAEKSCPPISPQPGRLSLPFAPAAAAPPSLWCAGPTLEIFLIQQVCWSRKSQQNMQEELRSLARTSGHQSWRIDMG